MRALLPHSASLMPLAGLLAILSGSSGFAQTPVSPVIAREAQQVLQPMSQLYRTAKAFGTDVIVQANVPTRHGVQPASMRYVFAVERPNRLAVAQRTTFTSPTIVCDGQSLTVFQPAQMQYTQKKAPAAFAALAKTDLADAGEGLGAIMYWLVQGDPYQAILRDTYEGRYVGQDMTNGVRTQHVTLVQMGWNVDIWIQADRPVLRQVHLTRQSNQPNPASLQPGQPNSPQYPDQNVPGQVIPGAQPDVTMAFGNWVVDGQLPEGTFQFTPPQGARKIGGTDDQATKPAGDSLLGQPVPPVTFDLLGPGQIAPAKMKGKVLVLCFWSVGAKSSPAVLPVLAEITAQYRSKGVGVYAVNSGDTPAQVRDFLAQAKVHVPVALDPGGEALKLYKVKAVPQVMIVDKNGIVQTADVPLGTDLKQELQKDIDAVLAGTKR